MDILILWYSTISIQHPCSWKSPLFIYSTDLAKKFFMPENSWDCIYFDPITPKLNFPWFAKIIGYFEPHLILATVVSFIISQKIYKLAVSPNLYNFLYKHIICFFQNMKMIFFCQIGGFLLPNSNLCGNFENFSLIDCQN